MTSQNADSGRAMEAEVCGLHFIGQDGRVAEKYRGRYAVEVLVDDAKDIPLGAKAVLIILPHNGSKGTP